MKTNQQSNMIPFLALTLGLFLLLIRKMGPQKTSLPTMADPQAYRLKEIAPTQAILRLLPDPPGRSIISLN